MKRVIVLSIFFCVFVVLTQLSAFALPLNRTKLVSKSSDGSGANGSSTINYISGNGRYIAFSSSASNIVAGDVEGRDDVFFADSRNGKIRRLSVNSAGFGGDSDSEVAGISYNGRYVVFSSNATNLVDNDTNGVSDAFLADTKLRTIRRISVSVNGDQGNQNTFASAVSDNGKFLLIASFATKCNQTSKNLFTEK